ncbi:MAG: homoserine dehydrogenase, partial [Halioglobus sp.]|nr:homoserine dehydrogenase [Halioglobus sp.]
MSAKPVTIGLCGFGTVGRGMFRVLQENAAVIAARSQAPLQVIHVGIRRDQPGCDLTGLTVSRDVMDVARDPAVDILVELIGGTTVAKELVETAIRHGKHVVTANKALIAEFGNEIFALADEYGVEVRFEAAVAGGIPIIKALREGLAGNRIEWLAGIINGTGNFILTEMRDKGREFADVLAEAQALGYAEADPTFDVEGIDAAHKLVILASIAFGMPLQFKSVYTEGITRLTTQDVVYARE